MRQARSLSPELAEPREAIEGTKMRVGGVVKEGRSHQKLSLGLQDAWYASRSGNVQVAVVCDGCSTSSQGLSENYVGATLGAQLVATSMSQLLNRVPHTQEVQLERLLWEVAQSTTRAFRGICRLMGEDPERDRSSFQRFVENKLLFTVVGVAIRGDAFWFFGVGDGYFGTDGSVSELNRSGYFNQALLRPDGEQRKELSLFESGRLDEVETLWVATDGLADFLAKEERRVVLRSFLADEFTSARNKSGEDTTVQAFNRNIYSQFRACFSDDVAIAVMRRLSVTS